MVNKTEVVDTMQALVSELQKNHAQSETTSYVSETLQKLKKSDGVAFIGSLQLFFNQANIVKLSDNIQLNKEEKTLWRKLFAFNSLGNNLWGASL